RLRARRGAVDLVCQQNIGEGRARDKLELARLLVIDADPRNVAGQQVRCTLQAAEVGVKTQRQCPRQHCLADTGDIFEQDMPLTEQGNDQGINYVAFADDDLFNILPDLLGKVLNCLACQKVPPYWAHTRWGQARWGSVDN